MHIQSRSKPFYLVQIDEWDPRTKELVEVKLVIGKKAHAPGHTKRLLANTRIAPFYIAHA